MKILHVCESVIGGTGSYLAELIPQQVRRYGADQVALLVPAEHMAYIEQSILDAGPQIFTFARESRLSGAVFLSGRYIKSLWSFKPDVVHAHSTVAGVIVRLLRLSRAKIVFCPHGWSVDMKGTDLVRKVAEWVERGLALLPDCFIVISRHEYDKALELGVSKDRLTLVPNGIRREPPDVMPAEWNDTRIKVLFAGRLDYQKGVDVLLKAVEGLEDKLVVRLVGDVAVGGKRVPMELPNNVEKLGWLDRSDVSAQMKSCDLLVVPSRWEGFGLVAIEAMRLSKPVVASSVGGLKDILSSGKCGYLVPPEDDAALRACLMSLDKDGLQERGAAAYQHFLLHYTSDRMVRQIDAIYAQHDGDGVLIPSGRDLNKAPAVEQGHSNECSTLTAPRWTIPAPNSAECRQVVVDCPKVENDVRDISSEDPSI